MGFGGSLTLPEGDPAMAQLLNAQDYRKAARDYLDGAAGVFNSQAGVRSASFHFVETA